MDASSFHRSVGVERTDSVSTLNYRPLVDRVQGTRRVRRERVVRTNRLIVTGIEVERVQNAIYRSTF